MTDALIDSIKKQRTFVMIKPDGLERGLVGQIMQRFEQQKLKLLALKMIWPTQEQVMLHYPSKDEERIKRLGTKSIGTFEQNNIDVRDYLGTNDPLLIGNKVLGYLTGYISQGPCVMMILQGVQAIDVCRKMVGNTIPANAIPGTIRADFSTDTALVANIEQRPMYNLVHASETPQEAAHEIALWFQPEEIMDLN